MRTSARFRVGSTVRIVSTDLRLGEVDKLHGQLATFLSRSGRRCAVALVEEDPRSIVCRSNGMLHFDLDEIELVQSADLRDATVDDIREEPTMVLQAMIDGDFGDLTEKTLELARQELADRGPVRS